MPATIATVATPAAPAAPAPVQTSAGAAEPSRAGPEGAAKPAAETPKPDAPKRFKAKYKDNGKEAELDLDESEAVREIQKARHYDKTRGEFEKREREFNERMSRIEKDPRAWFKERGIDVKQLAAEDIARETELAKLSPEARELAEARQRNQELEQKLQTHAEQQKQAADRAEHTQRVDGVKTQLRNAMKAFGRQDGETMRLVTDVLEMAERAGEPPMSTEQLVDATRRLESKRVLPFVKRALTDATWRAQNPEVMKELAQGILGALEGDELVDFIGKANGERIAKAQLAKFRKNPIPVVGQQEPLAQQPAQPKPPAQREERKSASVWGILDKLT